MEDSQQEEGAGTGTRRDGVALDKDDERGDEEGEGNETASEMGVAVQETASTESNTPGEERGQGAGATLATGVAAALVGAAVSAAVSSAAGVDELESRTKGGTGGDSDGDGESLPGLAEASRRTQNGISDEGSRDTRHTGASEAQWEPRKQAPSLRGSIAERGEDGEQSMMDAAWRRVTNSDAQHSTREVEPRESHGASKPGEALDDAGGAGGASAASGVDNGGNGEELLGVKSQFFTFRPVDPAEFEHRADAERDLQVSTRSYFKVLFGREEVARTHPRIKFSNTFGGKCDSSYRAPEALLSVRTVSGSRIFVMQPPMYVGPSPCDENPLRDIERMEQDGLVLWDG